MQIYATPTWSGPIFIKPISEVDLRGARLFQPLVERQILALPRVRPGRCEGSLEDEILLVGSVTSLHEVDLRNANLRGAIVTDKDLAHAKSLVGATMPDGSIRTEERWESFRKKDFSK